MPSPAAQSAPEADVVIRSRKYRTTEDYVRIDDAKVDLSYHRPYDPKHAKRMLSDAGGEYVEEVGRYILTSQRADGIYIIVGLHRAMMAKLAGEEFVPAVILHGITVEQEAELARIESARRKESPIDQFRQEVVAGHPEATAIVSILSRYGTKVAMNASPGSHPGAFDAVNTLRTVYRIDNGKTLGEALHVLQASYGRVPTDSKALRGLVDFLRNPRHRKVGVDKQRLIASLSRDGWKSQQTAARDLKPLDQPLRVGHFRAFVEAYNHGRRKDRLPMPWK